MRIAFSAAARRDRREAEAWYAQSPAAVAGFRGELQAAFRYISDHPLGAPELRGPVRGKTLPRYPYTVLYRITSDRIFVVAIADERRQPGTYDDR